MAFFSRIASLFRSRRLDQELEEEQRAHISMRTEELMAQGVPAQEARLRALRAFGNRALLKEETRDAELFRWLETLTQDIRFGIRQLRRNPGFTAVALLTLALGIGANTAMFSVVNAVLLRPLPFPEPQRIMSLRTLSTRNGAPQPNSLSYPDYHEYREGNRSMEAVASYYDNYLSLTGVGEPAMLRGQVVGADLFKILGVKPALGRGFLPADDAPGQHVAIISNLLWKKRFHSDSGMIGRGISLSGKEYTIVGVAPEGFQFPIQAQPTEVWVTVARDYEPESPSEKPVGEQRGAHFLSVIGRLKPGVTREQAETDLSAIARALSAQYPDQNKYYTAVRVEELLRSMVGDTRTPLTILLAAVGFVLLIACANVANLVLARSNGRSTEIAVRAALGASRGRIVRQLTTEAIMLSVGGAVLGALLAKWAVSATVGLYPQNLPRIAEVSIDGRVLLFIAGLAILTGILFGLAPAVHASRRNLNERMREGLRGAVGDSAHSRMRSVLVVAETAIGVMLLIGAGLLIRSLNRLSHVDLGLNPDHLLTAYFGLSEKRYNADQQDRFYQELMDKLRSLPGVTAAAGTQQLPLGNDDWSISFDVVERRVPESQQPSAAFYNVTSGFFETLQIPLLAGRTFNRSDTRISKPVMIINQEFANKYFPSENPLGKMVEIGVGEGKARARWKTREIVGIVGNFRATDLSQPARAAFFVPMPQLIWGPPTLVLRVAGDPNALVSSLRRVLAGMDPDAPLFEIKTMEDYLVLDLGRARFQTALLSLFAGIALLLTAIGLYGVVAYGVAQRTHEIGVRMALGASRKDVLQMVLNQGLLLTFLGVAVGVLGALGLAKFIESLLYQILPRDPATYLVVCVTLGVVALLASYIPAMRAIRVDPVVALRYE